MDGFDLIFLGYLSSLQSDKIWGALRIKSTGEFYTFWGRRGKKLQFKKYEQKLHSWGSVGRNSWQIRCELNDLRFKKQEKGYIDYTYKPEEAVEGFEIMIKKNFFNAKMMDKIR